MNKPEMGQPISSIKFASTNQQRNLSDKPTVFDVFEKELNLITDATVFKFTSLAFQHHCPDYFWTIPASVRGRHPPICRTRGGLVHHVKLATAFADQLLGGLGIDDMDPRYSQTIAAVMLHDMLKRGRPENELNTWANHKDANTNHGRYCAAHLQTYLHIAPEVEPVLRAIELHMGRWTANVTGLELAELTYTEVVRTTHLADYMASRALHQLLAERHTDPTMRYLND